MTNCISGCQGGCEDYNAEGDEMDESDAVPADSQRRQAATELRRFDLCTSDVDEYEGQDGNNGNNADADEEEEALQADDGLTQPLVH
jgi:hypothetical protein